LLSRQENGHLASGRFFHIPTTENLPDGHSVKEQIEADRQRFLSVLPTVTFAKSRPPI
jgi:hypothetical protein